MSLSALIIEPCRYTRGTLWQAMRAESRFSKVTAAPAIEEALKTLLAARFDVILISSAFPRDTVSQFISQSRVSHGGKEAAYISLVKAEESNRGEVAAEILAGIDGFLFVPFSVQALQDVAEIAAKVKYEHERKRAKVAIALILEEVHHKLASLIFCKRFQEDEEEARQGLEKCRIMLSSFRERFCELYFEVLKKHLENAQPETLAYAGASERLTMRARKKGRPQARTNDATPITS